MLLPAIPLDAAMPVSEALGRLAQHGLWRDSRHPAAAAVIDEHRARLAAAGKPISFDEAESRLRRDPARVGVAIRRQWHNQILWYARPATFVLDRCLVAGPADSLLEGLGLHEPDSLPPIPLPAAGTIPSQEGVVLDGGLPVAISLVPQAQEPLSRGTRSRPPDLGPLRGTTRGAPRGGTTAAPPSAEVRAWPLLDAPEHAIAGQQFNVVVGLEQEQQEGVTGDTVVFSAPPGATAVELTVELIADGVDAPDGWTRPLVVSVSDPTSARVTFTLVGRAPAGPEPVHLTMIEARYVLGGTICGTASRPLEIRAAGYAPPPDLPVIGRPWTTQPIVTSPMTSQADDLVADLTIEISKPDGNSTGSRYVCRLYSPHPIAADRGPHAIDFGDDSKTFARRIVDQIRTNATDPIVNKLLESYGASVADTLPEAAHDALYEVAEFTKPNPPAVLLVSAEPYVPWELALLDPPLYPELPPFLGVQTVLGRWLRDAPADMPPAAQPGRAPSGRSRRMRVRKPPIHPPGTISVRHMAVMAGMYRLKSGVKPLPEAEKEANEIAQQYDAVMLAASSQSLLQLLDARLQHKFEEIGAPGAVHFAGHGDFDPAVPDSSVMLLSDGKPISSEFFRSARYGGDRQPLIFLNACMIGIGGELLGTMGGFPGNCLKGGFGGLLGALWEINDTVAREIALEFWRRALPPVGGTAEPVGAILRDLRAKYDPDSPVPSYLAYVYYGHPRLTLQRTN